MRQWIKPRAFVLEAYRYDPRKGELQIPYPMQSHRKRSAGERVGQRAERCINIRDRKPFLGEFTHDAQRGGEGRRAGPAGTASQRRSRASTVGLERLPDFTGYLAHALDDVVAETAPKYDTDIAAIFS